MSDYFIFNGVNSSTYMHIDVLPPITRATKDMDKIEIAGRDGFLTIDNNGAYKGIPKQVLATVLDLENLDFICEWLDGKGEVIFSNEPTRKYKATIINQVDLSKILRTFHSILIQFECQPHKYPLDNYTETFTTMESIENGTNTISKPIIKVYGTGNIQIIINSQVVFLYNVVGYVTMDSEMVDCYKDNVLKNSDMEGEFLRLEVGSNLISWNGNVTKVEITPNFRYV